MTSVWSTVGLCAAVVCLGLAACDVQPNSTSTATLTYTEDARSGYQEALAEYEDENWDDARQLMSEVRRLFAYSRYARLAELRIADIDFKKEEYSSAVSGYRAFVRGHRGDPNVEYAKYRMTKALFLDINDTVLLPPEEERDQANSRDAYRELKVFLRRYPRSRYLIDAQYMLEVVTQRLVRHELYVARYYMRDDRFVAAVSRIDYALKNFPGSGLDAEALVLKGEVLLKMKDPKKARQVFDVVLRDYGGPFGQVAQRFLDRMNAAAAEDAAAESASPPDPE